MRSTNGTLYVRSTSPIFPSYTYSYARIGQDGKTSYVDGYLAAVNRVYTAENGEKREETTFVDVTLWGRTAEIAGEYLKKGRPVFIEGRLQLDSWEDKTSGQKRSKLKVVGEGLQLLGARPSGSGSTGGEEESSSAPRSSTKSAPPPKAAPAGPDDDEIPF